MTIEAVLKGGLDLRTAKSKVVPGRLLDCKNYETSTDQDGYAPISGFERFDGRMSPSVTDVWKIVVPNSAFTPAYVSKSFSVASEDSAPAGLYFSSDGLKFYVAGATNVKIFEYDLTTAWDVSTASYSGNSLDVSGQTSNPRAVAIGNSGGALYVMDTAGDVIYQYTLSTPYDVSTGSYASKSLDVSSEETTPRGMTIKPDGTELYIVGSDADNVWRYTMSTAWDLSTAALAGVLVNVFGLDAAITTPSGISFRSDGKKFWVSDTSGVVYQHSCSTAWVLGTSASYDSISFDTSSESSALNDVFFKPDGTRFYTIASGNDAVYQYNWTFDVNENLTWTLDGDTGNMGVVISLDHGATNATMKFAYWQAGDNVPDGATITGDDSGVTFTYDLANHTLTYLTSYAADAADLISELDTYAGVLRPAITQVPGMGPVLGIKRFEEQTYAIRNHHHFGFDGGDAEPANYQRIRDSLGNEGIVIGHTLDSGAFGSGTAAGDIIVDAVDREFSIADNDQFDLLGEIHFNSGSTEPSVGDTISGATSGSTAVVHRVELVSGLWADGDAAGIIYTRTESAEFDVSTPDNIDNDTTTDTNVATVVAHTLRATDDFIDATAETLTDSADAAMWRSTRTGWERVDLGWELTYDTGTNEPPTVILGGTDSEVATEQEQTDWKTANTITELTGGFAWTGLSSGNLSADDGTEATVAMSGSSGYISNEVEAKDFRFELDSSDSVLGFEVDFRTRQTAGSVAGRIKADGLYVFGSSPGIWSKESKASGYVISGATEQTVDLGSDADLWGGMYNGPLTVTHINSTDFGVRWEVGQYTLGGSNTYAVDRVRMRITYLPAGKKVYFWDSAGSVNYGQAIVTHDYVRSGSYAGTDAAGTYSLSGLTRFDLYPGLQIRSEAGGAGVLYAVVAGPPERVTMPGYAALEAEESRYEIIENNFYAKDDLNALWGVSGAGLAFVWDGVYFRQIRSGVAEARDKPRHLEAFQFRLVLGYSWGELNWSVAGTPLSFDGSLNAAATGFGFKIVGLEKLSGQMMAVFTDGGVFGAVVSGSNFAQQDLATNSRVVEYSVQRFGNQVVFCDQNGIRDLGSSEKYGDFEAGTLSSDVNKWLRPRLRKEAGTGPRNQNLVNSTIVRSKGHYRMYFADGWVLTMAFDYLEPPEFTFQKLWLDNDEDAYVRVLATDSEQDNDGTEHVYFSTSVRDNYDHGDDLGYVFQSDRGRSFDGDDIDCFCTLSWINSGNPILNYRYTIWILEGTSFNYATPTVDFAVDFAEPDGAGGETLNIGASTNAAILDSKAFFTKFRSQKRGRNIALRFDHNTSTELPHLLQFVYSVDESQGRKEV